MLLVIDVGNTNTVLGLFAQERLVHDWRLRTDKKITEDELGVLISSLFTAAGVSGKAVSKVVIASVVPPVDRIYEIFCRKHLFLSPRWIDAATVPGIRVSYANPAEIGADRVVNAVAAYHRYRCGLIVIDFGTAITFDLISPEGEYRGGLIAPGLSISAEALFQEAAKLPRVDLRTPPEQLVGSDTAASIKSGLIYGFAGLVDGLVHRLQAEQPALEKVIATGGLAALIAEVCETIEAVEPNLTLEGLRIIADQL